MAELRDYGLVKNTSRVMQQIGPHKIAAGSIGRLPAAIVENIRTVPIQGLIVLDQHPDLVPFFHTDVVPFGPRYPR